MKKNTYLTRLLSMLLVVALCLGLVACSNSAKPNSTTAQKNTDPTEEMTYPTFPVYTRPEEDEEDEEIYEGEEDSDTETGEDGEVEEEQESSSETTESTESSADADSDDPDASFGNTSSTVQKGNGKNLTWANINSFSIKSGSMSVTQLRNLCVDFFRFAKTALWTPSESISYTMKSSGLSDAMTGGSLYGGVPYVSLGTGNVYRLMDYINESTGKVDMADALELDGGQLSMEAMKYFGNQCSHGAYVGWGRVINSVKKYYTTHITKTNGYIPLGRYTYDTSKVTAWSSSYGTDEVCRENGEQIMYESYAKLQPADGLVFYTSGGHVIMCASKAHVEYINGTNFIDGEKSYITIVHQTSAGWATYTTTAGKTYKIKNDVDVKISFKKLFNSNYIPFTFAEFTGSDPVEATTYSFSRTESEITKSKLFSAKITSNYSISDAYVIVKDSSGKQVYKHAVRNSTAYGKTLTLAPTGANVDSWGVLNSGTYTVEVVAQLMTGERPTVYTGKLVVE